MIPSLVIAGIIPLRHIGLQRKPSGPLLLPGIHVLVFAQQANPLDRKMPRLVSFHVESQHDVLYGNTD